MLAYALNSAPIFRNVELSLRIRLYLLCCGVGLSTTAVQRVTGASYNMEPARYLLISCTASAINP